MLKKINEIRQTPIYKRERGEFGGNPNPIYTEVSRYTPLVVISILVISFCCGGNSLTTAFGVDSTVAVLFAISCLPNFIVQVLTWTGLFLVPPLLAPAMAYEVKLGTWDILRMTPYSTQDILLAKILGGLSRLKIWTALLILNGIQLFISTIAVAILATETGAVGLLLLIPTIILAALRPWIEIGFAALTSLIASTFTDSARGALISTYSTLLVMKFFTNQVFWAILGLAISEALSLGNASGAVSAWVAPAAPALIFSVALGIAWFIFRRRSRILDL